ncbi:MAG: hypothetical protein M1489_06815 [Firmicutes bacterium]|nr:hypothetical protein [Bacillota bacterium]
MGLSRGNHSPWRGEGDFKGEGAEPLFPFSGPEQNRQIMRALSPHCLRSGAGGAQCRWSSRVSVANPKAETGRGKAPLPSEGGCLPKAEAPPTVTMTTRELETVSGAAAPLPHDNTARR